MLYFTAWLGCGEDREVKSNALWEVKITWHESSLYFRDYYKWDNSIRQNLLNLPHFKAYVNQHDCHEVPRLSLPDVSDYSIFY